MSVLRLKSLIKTFRGDLRGIAAVEFGLIAPIALLMMLGTVELGRAVVMARRFNLVTAVIGDLVSREHELPDPPATPDPQTEMTAISKAASLMWQPYDATSLKFLVMQIRNGAATAKHGLANQNYVDWPYPMFGATAPAACSVYPGLPAGMIPSGQAAIIVNGWYTYKPLFATLPFATSATWNWTATSSHSPRVLGCVDYNVNSCATTCEN